MEGFQERPRELRWYHAAGLMFGDWGTSRLYVLGIAFVASAAASFWYVAGMCLLVALVGFAYSVICAHFPDGGGVYSAARHRSKTLAVLGALLLIADYINTAALSAYVGFRYILPTSTTTTALYLAMGAVALIGVINIFGLRRVGILATGVGLLAAVLYLVIGIFCIPELRHAHVEWPHRHMFDQWTAFVGVILALSGIESIANMTGVMAEPVGRNARRAIFLVMFEVVLLNLIMGFAMNALTPQMLENYAPSAREDYMVKIIAEAFVHPWFSSFAAVVFGVLLLSATNTAISSMVSIQYLMSRDNELPAIFTRLNRYGMPWFGLLTATLIPIGVLLWASHYSKNDQVMALLAGLYAIGVVGAIAINLLTCGSNLKLKLKHWERWTLILTGLVVFAIEFTIAWTKLEALIFACIILTVGLAARFVAKRVRVRALIAEEAVLRPVSEPARVIIPSQMPRLLVPTRGHPKLLKFAVNYAKDKHAALFILFVREVTLAFRERGGKLATETMTLANDKEAQQIFEQARKTCEAAGVPMVPLYAVHDSPAELILDHAATQGADAVLMGVSKRGALWKTLRGDVLQEVINYLPESIPLLIHA